MLHAVSYSDFSHWFNFSRRGQSRFGLLSALNLAFSPRRRNRPATRSFIRLIVRPIPSRLFPKTRRTSKPAPRRRGWGEGGNAAMVFPELLRCGFRPDLVTDQTSAHDPLNGYVPSDLSLAAAAELRARDPAAYIERSRASMATQVRAMLAFQKQGSHVF